MTDNDILAREEKERIIETLFFYGVNQKKIEMYDVIIDNVAWMKIKLEETRETIKTSQVAIAYDNGGGQKGIRENPIFKGYESLWKSYMSGMQQIINLLPEEKAKETIDEVKKTRTMLDLVRDKHNVKQA